MSPHMEWIIRCIGIAAIAPAAFFAMAFDAYRWPRHGKHRK